MHCVGVAVFVYVFRVRYLGSGPYLLSSLCTLSSLLACVLEKSSPIHFSEVVRLQGFGVGKFHASSYFFSPGLSFFFKARFALGLVLIMV